MVLFSVQETDFKMIHKTKRTEYKNLDVTLGEAGLFDGSRLLLEEGTPLLPGEVQIDVFFANAKVRFYRDFFFREKSKRFQI